MLQIKYIYSFPVPQQNSDLAVQMSSVVVLETGLLGGDCVNMSS